jgi:hypothetical protein
VEINGGFSDALAVVDQQRGEIAELESTVAKLDTRVGELLRENDRLVTDVGIAGEREQTISDLALRLRQAEAIIIMRDATILELDELAEERRRKICDLRGGF